MRIVSGKHKGTKLLTFDYTNIRPTLDKVREGIFNKIQFDIVDASVLDLFAGTGAFSLEALSRGAADVVVVDNNSDSINLINKNYQKCHEKCNCINADYKSAISILEESGKVFDFIFLDPPYNTGLGLEAMSILKNSCIVNEQSLFIYETDGEIDVPIAYQVVDKKKYGRVFVYFMKLA